MNKLIIFDLDGVLIESKQWHFDALNNALKDIDENFQIPIEEHLAIYDGLNTTKKLELLSINKGLEKKHFNEIWKNKQKYTFEIIASICPDNNLIRLFKTLKSKGYQLAVASNSIRETVKLILLKLGILEYIDLYLSNEDVYRTKPFPEMYWKCMIKLNCLPKNTLIIEDSHIGRQGAIDSGSHLLAIENPQDLSLEKILTKLNEMENMNSDIKIPWIDKKLNVVIAMAGLGSRFSEKGYTFPKPMIDVFGKPMVQVVVENLNIDANYIFLVQKEHIEKYNLEHMLKLIKPNCTVVAVDGITQGSPCTVLLAKEHINNDNPIFLANCDQFIEWNSNEVMYSFSNDNIDGGLLVFKSISPKWSFCKLDENGFVSQVAEKDPISDIANVGCYYWKRGSDFVKYAEQMIEKNIRFKNEFYTAPVFNEAIADGKKIKVKFIERMWGLGTPEDLEYFIANYRNNLS